MESVKTERRVRRNWLVVRASTALSLSFIGLGLAAGASAAAEDAIPEIYVVAQRLGPAPNEAIFSTTVIDRDALAESGTGRLDDVLRDIPGFSLFRRQSSQASHPTTQGVTLRGLGPSGAGRTLILLDGVPQNDPFGGWIDWNRLPPADLDNAEVTRGGGAGPWGNAALAGTIRLQSNLGKKGTGTDGELSGNSFGGGAGRIAAYGDIGRVHVAVSAAGHFGDGPYLIREDQRGAADVRTNDRGGILRGTIAVPLDDATTVTLTGGTSTDRYINGIAIAKSVSRATDGALSIVHDAGPDNVGWEAHVYGRTGNLPAVFSSVPASRATATPSLNQFDVPSTAVGGNAIVRVPVSHQFNLDVGADIRRVTGETNELYTFVAPSFTHVRRAGGEQVVGGAFAEGTWMPQSTLTLTAAARIDYYKQMDGIRREADYPTGAVLRDDHYPAKDGSKGNFRLGAKYDASESVTLKAAAYTGFRVPTLNELYRPFRVGNDITEANPNLQPESLKGVEASILWAPTSTVHTSATFFLSRLDHAVGNVTIQTTPGNNAQFGVFVPAGGTLRQRQNIDRIRTQGTELEVVWQALPNLDFTGRYIFTDPKVTKNAGAPALVGLQLAEVARHQGMLEAAWRPWDGALLKVTGHAFSGQYDDDQNTRRLGGYATLDVYAETDVTPNIALFLNAENLFDRSIEAGLSAGGLVTIGMPRVVTGGVRWRL
jgi:outer membrane receptor protein involved in Fe transport